MSADHTREMAFLRQFIRYDATAEHCKLEEEIVRIQRDERCVQRAIWLMGLLILFALSGLLYATILSDISEDSFRLVFEGFGALGLGAMISFAAFWGLRLSYRGELARRREECRRLAMRVLESHLGNPGRAVLASVAEK